MPELQTNMVAHCIRYRLGELGPHRPATLVVNPVLLAEIRSQFNPGEFTFGVRSGIKLLGVQISTSRDNQYPFFRMADGTEEFI